MIREEVNLGIIGVNVIVEDTRVNINSIFDQHFVNTSYVPGNLQVDQDWRTQSLLLRKTLLQRDRHANKLLLDNEVIATMKRNKTAHRQSSCFRKIQMYGSAPLGYGFQKEKAICGLHQSSGVAKSTSMQKFPTSFKEGNGILERSGRHSFRWAWNLRTEGSQKDVAGCRNLFLLELISPLLGSQNAAFLLHWSSFRSPELTLLPLTPAVTCCLAKGFIFFPGHGVGSSVYQKSFMTRKCRSRVRGRQQKKKMV